MERQWISIPVSKRSDDERNRFAFFEEEIQNIRKNIAKEPVMI